MASILVIQVFSWIFCIVFWGLFFGIKNEKFQWLRQIFGIISLICAIVGILTLFPVVYHSFKGDINNYTFY